MSTTNHEFFINFGEILKLLSFFEVIAKKIHINYKTHPTHKLDLAKRIIFIF
jgi:hypothetical protein